MIVKDPLSAGPIGRPLIVSFLAPSSNTGRTSVVTNLAWLFARQRRNVLVLDLSSEGTEVHEYLAPFMAEQPTTEVLVGSLMAGMLDSASGGAARSRRYAVGPGRLDVIRTTVFQEDVARRVSDALRTSSYDYVLVDASTGDSPRSLAALAALSDRVVVCMSPQSRSVRDAANLTSKIFDQWPGGHPPVLVISQFGADSAQADRSRSDISRAFEQFFVGDTPARLVTLPTQPYYDYLAVVKEPTESGLRDAYRELAAAVAASDTVGSAVAPPSLSNRYVAAMDSKVGSHRAEQGRERAAVFFHPADGQAMEFVARQLRHNGIEADPRVMTGAALPSTDLPVVVLISPKYGPDEWDRVLARRSGTAEPEIIVVTLHDEGVPNLGRAFSLADLSHHPTQEIAAGQLFGAMGMAGLAGPAIEGSRNLLARPTHVNAAPRRESPFLGRDDEIRTVREQLTSAEQHVIVVRAPTGMGKTALVREYFERFVTDYDTAWWVPAHDAAAIRQALSQLGEKLAARERGDMVAAALDTLATASPPRGVTSPGRWLLIYDGVRDMDVLNGLLPVGGNGHVIITTRAESEEWPGHTLQLGPLQHKDAVDGLIEFIDAATDHVAVLTPQDADVVVHAVQGVPIGFRLARTYLAAVVGGEARLELTGTASTLDPALRSAILAVQKATATPGHGFADLFELIMGLLHGEPYGKRANHLAEMCSFLSADGVDLRLLRAPAMLAQFTAATGGNFRTGFTVDDIDRAMWTGVAFGLFSVDWQDPAEPLRVVPAVQRLLLDRMTADARDARRKEVRLGLAAIANALPWEADTRMRTAEATWTAAIYAELQRHMVECGALDDDDPDVREWAVREIRYQNRTSDLARLRHTERMATTLFQRWHRDHPADLLTLRLANELTNILRGLGRYRDALDIDQQMLRESATRLERDHFRILVLRRGIAANQRALGRFASALSLDQSTWNFFRDTHGADHPETLTTGHNLAVSQFLSGQVPVALTTEEEVYQGRCRLLGDTGRQTLWSEMEIGIYIRELGDFVEAANRLQNVESRMRQAGLPRVHPLSLRAHRHWAIAHRLAGNIEESRGALQPILDAYEDLLGPDHPLSWATRLSVAAEASDSADHVRAVELASSVLAHYESSLGEHPFTAAARANLAVYEQRAGRPGDAATHSQNAHRELLYLLGEPHPWTIGALIGRVLVEAGQQNYAMAAELAEEAHFLALEYLPREGPYRHPCLLIASQWREDLRDGQALRVLLAEPARRRYLDITIPET